MILSTPRFKYLKGLAAALVIPLAVLIVAHCGLEALSHWAEAKPGYYLWRTDERLMLLSPAKFSRPGKGRLMIFGASETGEGFIDSVMKQKLPGLAVENMAIDGANFTDVLFQMEYLQSIYGPAAVPSDIVVGLTQRFVANIPIPKTRLFREAIDKYSPGITDSGPTARVARKGFVSAAASWLEFRLHQTERYRCAMEALWIELASAVSPEWTRKHDLRSLLIKAKTWSRARGTDSQIRALLTTLPHWRKTHAWKASDHRDAVEGEMKALIEFAKRYHSRLYFVNIPLLPVNKSMFAPGVYEDYLQVINAARGDAPLLDLGEFLPAADFSDAVHATGKGAARISVATAEFIQQHELGTQAVQ